MIKVIIRDKATNYYIGEMDIYKDEVKNLEDEFIIQEVK